MNINLEEFKQKVREIKTDEKAKGFGIDTVLLSALSILGQMIEAADSDGYLRVIDRNSPDVNPILTMHLPEKTAYLMAVCANGKKISTRPLIEISLQQDENKMSTFPHGLIAIRAANYENGHRSLLNIGHLSFGEKQLSDVLLTRLVGYVNTALGRLDLCVPVSAKAAKRLELS